MIYYLRAAPMMLICFVSGFLFALVFVLLFPFILARFSVRDQQVRNMISNRNGQRNNPTAERPSEPAHRDAV